MANKAKIKCATCHKTFKSNRSSQLICDDCERKRRLEKVVATTKPAQPVATATAPGAKPAWLTQATVRDPNTPQISMPAPDEPRHQPHVPATARPTVPLHSGPKLAVAKPAVKKPRTPQPPKPKTPKLSPPPFAPTPEQVAAIELRYLELAQPEFDGVRTQIAQEMSIPKRVVREVVAQLRMREHLPSWWEIQQYTGTPEELARIKTAYIPLLPVPPIGVHKLLAPQLGLSAGLVYYGIRAIRQELHLPDFNPPEMHPELQTAAAH